jgi:hypothetical protein
MLFRNSRTIPSLYESSITIFNPMVPVAPHASITRSFAHISSTFLPRAHRDHTGERLLARRRSGRITSPSPIRLLSPSYPSDVDLPSRVSGEGRGRKVILYGRRHALEAGCSSFIIRGGQRSHNGRVDLKNPGLVVECHNA